jgi:5-methylcytosine-specific restriction endonuclease McrA
MQPYDHWYFKERWRRKSRLQLKIEPLCRRCSLRGEVTPATCADHITPHRGDEQAFWFGALQSLCAACHANKTNQEEKSGFSREIGADGWPTDREHHPVYRASK